MEAGREAEGVTECHDRRERELEGGRRCQGAVVHVDAGEVAVQDGRRRERQAPKVARCEEHAPAEMDEVVTQQAEGHHGDQHRHSGEDGRAAAVQPDRQSLHAPSRIGAALGAPAPCRSEGYRPSVADR